MHITNNGFITRNTVVRLPHARWRLRCGRSCCCVLGNPRGETRCVCVVCKRTSGRGEIWINLHKSINLFKAITTHAESLTSHLDESELREILGCYDTAITVDTSVDERRQLLHLLINAFNEIADVESVEAYLRGKLIDAHWSEWLCDVLRCRPISMQMLGAEFKLDLLQVR